MASYDRGIDEVFVSYQGDSDIHDGRVVAVEHGRDFARVVVVDATTGRRIEVVSTGVESLEQHHAEGMLLYALSEMEAPSPLRRFVFVNSIGDEGDDARLEVLAHDFDCREVSTT